MRGFLTILGVLWAADAAAVTSTRSVPSAFGGNGHNASFDGRLFIVRDSFGWQAMVLRPEAVTYLPDGLPDALGPMWSERTLILGPGEVVENALAMCEETAQPTSCGAEDCYDFWILDSDAVTPDANVLRRRHLTIRVESPRTPSARVSSWEWGPTQNLSPTLRGIEPTVTADGKLLIWQGHPANDGQIDILVYAVNASACAASGWTQPKSISEMASDPAIVGTYRLGDRTLRAADGATFAAGDLFHGAYPWVMPNGDAIIFTGAPMPCRATEDPPGCGPRRNALSVIGYPTNWGVAHIDGDVNPSTTDTVRLFFSSPGPTTFPGLPVTPGEDVWPFFGSNTSNYVELIFDDGLDGNYAGFWHLNESITKGGDLDPTRTPDVSGYFNTGTLQGGLTFAAANDGVVGKSLLFDGVDDRVEVPSSASLSPVNGLTIDFWLRPSNPDCDANPNYRLLLGKGNIGDGAYSVIFEENGALHARVNVGGTQQELWGPPVTFDAWTHASFEYDGATGAVAWFYDGAMVASGVVAAGQIAQTSHPLTIGGPGPRDACPNGDGSFGGRLDEVAISRVARRIGTPTPDPIDGGVGVHDSGPDPGDPDGGVGPGAPDAAQGASGASGGCGCHTTRDPSGGGAAAALITLLAAVRTAASRRRRPRS